MKSIILPILGECANCGVKARFYCHRCEKLLCGRCISKEKRDLVSDIIQPSGLCKECTGIRIAQCANGNLNPLSEAISRYAPSPLEKAKGKEKIYSFLKGFK